MSGLEQMADQHPSMNKSLDFSLEIEAMQNHCGDQYFSESVMLLMTTTKLNTI
jgi:hypothetical protein